MIFVGAQPFTNSRYKHIETYMHDFVGGGGHVPQGLRSYAPALCMDGDSILWLFC